MSAVFRLTGRMAVAARNGGGAGFGSPSLLRLKSNFAGGQSREAAAIMAEIEEMIEKERASSLLTLMNDLSRNTKLGGSRIGRMEAVLEERARMTLDLARRSARTADDMEQLKETMDGKMRALNEMDVKTRVLNEKLRSKTEELESLRWCVMCALRTVAVVSAAGAGAMVLMAVWEL